MPFLSKKIPAKFGRELFNQGASTDLVSGRCAFVSGQFGFFTADEHGLTRIFVDFGCIEAKETGFFNS